MPYEMFIIVVSILVVAVILVLIALIVELISQKEYLMTSLVVTMSVFITSAILTILI